jgi:hypothetical protein
LGVVATLVVKGYAFTSVWCLYAAVVSAILYWQFRGRRIDIADPNGRVHAPVTA